jgi:hypothetical protein
MSDSTHIPPTSLHFPIFHFPPLLDISSQRFKSLHFTSLIVAFPALCLKVCALQGKVAGFSAGSWFKNVMFLFTKDYFPIPVLCFLAQVFLS